MSRVTSFNSSSSLIQSKVTGNMIFVLLPPLSPMDLFVAYVLGAMTRGIVVGMGVFIVTLLFIGSWFMRRGDPALPPIAAVVSSAIAVGIALVTGWLGGELVDRLAVGVDDGAHLDAPSSLSGPVPQRRTTP